MRFSEGLNEDFYDGKMNLLLTLGENEVTKLSKLSETFIIKFSDE